MDISDIHFHDSQILSVIEDPQADTLTMEIDYPVDYDANIFEPHRLVFSDAYNYQVHEMPFDGCPTILEVEVMGTTDRWTHLRMETNAGFRSLSCASVVLLSTAMPNPSFKRTPDGAA